MLTISYFGICTLTITPFHKIEEKKGTPTFKPKALLLRSEAVVVVVKVKV